MAASTSRPTLYQSFPLSARPSCIRLLEVEAASFPGDEALIRGNFQVIDLEAGTLPHFAALSYVCGKGDGSLHRISCDGFELDVLPNCHSALRHLRKKLGAFTIWVDAICIDPSNDPEKENQIPQMGQIYSRADVVYIWLGEGSTRTSRAMADLEDPPFVEYCIPDHSIEQGLSSPRPWAAFWSLLLDRPKRHGRLPLLSDRGITTFIRQVWSELTRHFLLVLPRWAKWKAPKLVADPLDDLSELLDHDWLRRMWTYQDILVASSPVVVCGDDHLSWPRFALSIIYLEYSTVNYDLAWKPKVSTLEKWATLALGREILHTQEQIVPAQSRPQEEVPAPTPAQRYLKFVYTLHRMLQWVQDILLFNIIALAIVFGGIRYFGELDKPSSGWAILGRFIFLLSLSIYATLTLLADLRSFSRVSAGTEFISGAYKGTSMIDLVEGLCTREATRREDKAFALQSILQQMTKRRLPKPDYSRPLDTIYHELAVNVLEANEALHLLLPAALNRLQGMPSWVPDWSAHFDGFWMRPRRSITSDISIGQRAYWRLWDDGDYPRITIHGCIAYHVQDYFEFKETSEEYDTSQEHIHVHNLGTILRVYGAAAHSKRRGSDLLSACAAVFREALLPKLKETACLNGLRLLDKIDVTRSRRFTHSCDRGSLAREP